MSYHFILKDARRKSGLSLRTVAEQVHLNPSTLYRYEEGLILNIPFQTLLALYRFYHISFVPEPTKNETAKARYIAYCDSLNMLSGEMLQQHFMNLDARGRKTVYKMLLWEEKRMNKKTADSSTAFSAVMPQSFHSDT